MGKDYRSLYIGLGILFGTPSLLCCCAMIRVCFPKIIAGIGRLLCDLCFELGTCIDYLILLCNKLDTTISNHIFPLSPEKDQQIV